MDQTAQTPAIHQAYSNAVLRVLKLPDAILPNEAFGLPALEIFTIENQIEATRTCFDSPGNIFAHMVQDLYLLGKPSLSELEIMNLKTVQEMTGWNSHKATVVQYFAAAYIARLALAIKLDPSDRYGDLLNLSFYAAAESKSAFPFYGEFFQTAFANSRKDGVAPSKKSWIARLFE